MSYSSGADLLGESFAATGDETTVLGNEATENERADSGKLDEDVDGGARGILERITDGITRDGGSLDVLEERAGLGDPDGITVLVLAVEDKHLSLNEFLGVIPSTTGVGGGECDLDTGDDAASKDTVSGLEAEEIACNKRGEDNEEAWGYHLLERSVGGDGDAVLVVGLPLLLLTVSLNLRVVVLGLVHLLELLLNLSKHLLSGVTDSLHGHGGEPVREHSAEEEASESEGLEDVDLEGLSGVRVVELGEGGGNTSDESTEEGKSDEAGRANGEALTDGSGGVASSVKSIGALTDGWVEVGHLSNTAGVVRDRTIAVNGEGDGEAAKHANGSESDTIHGSDIVGDEDGDGKAENGDDGGEVAEGKTVDDLRGGTVIARLSELQGGGVLLGGVVLGDQANEETGPEAEDDASIGLPRGGVVGLASELNLESFGEDEGGRDDHAGHEESGNPELDFEGSLDLLSSDVGEELADEGGNDTDGSDGEREVHGFRSLHHGVRGGRDDESSAGGLSERAEKISTHASDVTNIVTNVVSNGTGVERRVFGEALADLSRKISTDISSLGVDTATNTSEECDGGATETIARDELEEVSASLLVLRGEGSLVGEDDDLEDKKGKTDEAEAEDLSTLEGNHEAVESINVAKIGGFDVTSGGNHHADVAAKHRGTSSNEEGDGGVGEGISAAPRHIDGTENDDGEKSTEDGKSQVLLLEEGDSTLRIYNF